VKVYFACSIRGGGDTSNYITILDAIKKAGGDVLSEIFVHDAIHLGGSPLPADQIFKRDIGMIQEADLVIAEVSNPSLGVGYELAYAQNLGRPILCLYNKESGGNLSAMISGNSYNTVVHYDTLTLATVIESFLTAPTTHRTVQKRMDH
jgi:nucleoside 2-deoxyribosyltransferase